MRSRISKDRYVTDFSDCCFGRFGAVVQFLAWGAVLAEGFDLLVFRVLSCCVGRVVSSAGSFPVEPGARHRSNEDFHKPHREADSHNVSREKMECNRGDRGK